MPSQSEKRLAKDLRRLRMVSAFTSSWLRLARGAGVSGMLKVLVRDWDLLQREENGNRGEEEAIKVMQQTHGMKRLAQGKTERGKEMREKAQ